MKFRVNASLKYSVDIPSTLILNLHALRTPNQAVLEEAFTVTPYMKVEELLSTHGENRFIRVEIPNPANICISYKATIDNCYKIVDLDAAKEYTVAEMKPDVLPYLFPSRYCQSDKLYRFAHNAFGSLTTQYSKVVALTDWIHHNVEYLSGSTNSQTSAYETITEQAGVCRDFAHLGIALCRALTIPARYFTGYAYQLNPPDFHACFEAYLGGEWILFDATKLAPLNGMVKIATGRDAADSALASIFGKVTLDSIDVGSDFLDDNFQPFFYQGSDMKGISYL